MANNILASLQKCVAFSRRAEVIQLTFLAHVRFVGFRFPYNYYLESIYGPVQKSLNDAREQVGSGFGADLFRIWQDPAQFDGRERLKPDWSNGAPRRMPSQGFSSNMKRRLLTSFKAFNVFRIITTFWLIYVLIKFCLADQLAAILSKGLDLPLHCYMAGRLIVYDKLSDIIGCQFAILHLSWRLSQNNSRPFHKLSLISFLASDLERLERVYSKLGRQINWQRLREIRLSVTEFQQLDYADKLILDTLCFPIWHNTGVIYRLRCNRTHTRYDLFRGFVSGYFFPVIIVRVLAQLFINYKVVHGISSDETYARLYPNCGHPRGWHRYYSFFMDIAENFIICFEGGIVWSAAGTIILLTWDLIVLWLSIKRRISQLLEEISQFRLVGLRASSRRQQRFQRDIQDLIARMCDFFEQVSQVNQLISVFLVGLFGASLLICTIFTYYTRAQAIRQVPPQFGVMATFVLSWILTTAYGFLLLNNICNSSYVNLCSLIAHDPRKSEHNYRAVLDYFIKRRACFTLVNGIPFRRTTFLTMIGWIFTCFCMITSMLRDNNQLDLIARGYDH